MRVIILSSLALLAACGHGRAWSEGHPGWEPLVGTYGFSGVLTGSPAASVSGTLAIEEGMYRLSSDHGSCDGRLVRPPEGQVTLGCRNIRVTLRRAADGFAAEGSVHVTVPGHREQTSCRTDAAGNRVCTTREVSVPVDRSGRVAVRGPTAAGTDPIA